MRGKLTPDQRGAIVARYLETANASQVASEFDVDEKTVRNVLAAANAPKRSELHARACERGVREGRRALVHTARLLQRWLDEHARPDAPTMEPGDVAKVATSLRGIVAGVIECDEHRERKRAAKLTRDLKRAEIELARIRIKAGGVEQHAHTINAGVVVLPALDAVDSMEPEPRPANAVSGE